MSNTHVLMIRTDVCLTPPGNGCILHAVLVDNHNNNSMPERMSALFHCIKNADPVNDVPWIHITFFYFLVLS